MRLSITHVFIAEAERQTGKRENNVFVICYTKASPFLLVAGNYFSACLDQLTAIRAIKFFLTIVRRPIVTYQHKIHLSPHS